MVAFTSILIPTLFFVLYSLPLTLHSDKQKRSLRPHFEIIFTLYSLLSTLYSLLRTHSLRTSD